MNVKNGTLDVVGEAEIFEGIDGEGLDEIPKLLS